MLFIWAWYKPHLYLFFQFRPPEKIGVWENRAEARMLFFHFAYLKNSAESANLGKWQTEVDQTLPKWHLLLQIGTCQAMNAAIRTQCIKINTETRSSFSAKNG